MHALNDTVLMSARHLSLAFDGRSIISNVSFDIHANQIITLIGPNGSGKTTLSRILLGLQKADTGTMTKNKPLIIGYVPQKLSIERLLPITVARFLQITPSKKISNTRAEIKKIAEKTGINHLLTSQIHDLSGGETQRMLLARALLRNPNLMILDEPTQGMDIHAQAEFYQLLETIKQEQKCAIFMISHDLHVVMASTSHVICLNRHICCEGMPEEISKHPEYIALFGKKEARSMAVYSHHHDHIHTSDGHICSSDHPTDAGQINDK